MDLINLGAVLTAIIAAVGAWAAQRSASKANILNTEVSGRLEAEEDAFVRARAFDIQTIERQDRELRELREKNARLEEEAHQMRDEINFLKQRLARLENITTGELERSMIEHFEQDDDR